MSCLRFQCSASLLHNGIRVVCRASSFLAVLAAIGRAKISSIGARKFHTSELVKGVLVCLSGW